MIFFLAILFGVLFSSHYFLYFSAVHFFSFSGAFQRHIFFYALAFLSVSFIAATFLASWKENILTRSFYFFSGVWISLLINLVLASAIIWIIIGLAKAAKFDVNPGTLGAVFFALAFAYSFYGIWNAVHPQLKNISVTIPNLPGEWKGKKIVQLSDVHIGHIHREGFVDEIVAKTNSAKPEIVVITGDLFDGMDGDLSAPSKLLDNIKSNQGVYFITGNHETYLGVDKAFSALEKTKVNILRDQVVDVNGMKLIGIDYPERGASKDVPAVLHSLAKDFSGKPNIFLYHAPVNIEEAKNTGVNLQLSGHAHKGQMFPFGFITKIVFKGYDYGLHKIGNYSIYTTCGTGTWGPPVRTGNMPEIVVITLK